MKRSFVALLLCLVLLLPPARPAGASGPRAAAAPAATAAPAGSRGYLTTPQELRVVAAYAERGTEPFAAAVAAVIEEANRTWNHAIDSNVTCQNADRPTWIDDQSGTAKVYSRALSYHLTGEQRYAAETLEILEKIMTEAVTISLDEQQCRLNFSWGTPELVASADLIEEYWADKTCSGPASSVYGDRELIIGPCKRLFQNWLAKNPYFVVSYTAERAQSNWGAAATNTLAYIADYLWDRPEMRLLTRTSRDDPNRASLSLSPAQAYARANKLALDRMNGYRVELDSSNSCDTLNGSQQRRGVEPVKSQITAGGIIPEDARRDEYCNIAVYDGTYQNYPQVHLGNNIQQCELMLRRGDSSCYDNVSTREMKRFFYLDRDSRIQVVRLEAGRGSIERAINAIIIDSGTGWEHDAALEVAYRYYAVHHRLDGVEQWFAQLDRPSGCSQDICFGTLTHAFLPGETPKAPPVVAPPR